MCGIVAYSGVKPYNADKIKLLLTYNSLERGSDALGIYSPSTGIVKKAGKPIDLLSSFISETSEDNFFIGHVRAATVGDKTKDENAHPFERGNYIGVMNGTVKALSHLLQLRNLNVKDFTVDSDAILAMIAADNNFSCLKQIDGGCAIVVVNKEHPTTLRLWRNSDRPLYRGNVDGGMYISSIKESLDIIGCTNIKEISTENLYTITDGTITKNKVHKKEEFKEPVDPNRWKTIDEEFLNNKINVELYDFVNRWIRCDAPGYDNSYSYGMSYYEKVKLDNWYLCTGYNKSTNSLKISIGNVEREIVITAFDKRSAFRNKGAHVKIMSDLFCNKEKVVSMGDIMYFDGISQTKNKYVVYKENPVNNTNSDNVALAVDLDCFRNLTSAELYQYNTMKSNYSIVFPDDKEETKTETNVNVDKDEDDSVFIDKVSLEELYEKITQAIKDFKHCNNFDSSVYNSYTLINTADLKFFIKTIEDELDDFVLLTDCAN